MSALTIVMLGGGDANDFRSQIDNIEIDAVVRETHLLAAEVTEHPVEDGGNISDNYRPAPRALEIEGIITETPLRLPRSHAGASQPIEKTIEVPDEAFGMQLGPIPISIKGIPLRGSHGTYAPEMQRVRDTWEEFKSIFAQRRIVDVVTMFEIYPSMALTSLEVDHRGRSYHFTCTAQQILVVKSGRVDAAAPKVERAKALVKRGTQNPKPDESEDTRSSARKITDKYRVTPH